MPDPKPERPAPFAASAWADGPAARPRSALGALAFPPDMLWDGRPLTSSARIVRLAPWDTITFIHRGARRRGIVVEALRERVRVVVDGAVFRIPREDVLSLNPAR